jgi:hypothetical protein
MWHHHEWCVDVNQLRVEHLAIGTYSMSWSILPPVKWMSSMYLGVV